MGQKAKADIYTLFCCSMQMGSTVSEVVHGKTLRNCLLQ